MYLQSLEMIGFKSFANRTILNFHRGVTAVVGPNGCGKSNVLDALRWVLGEQSAKALRGGEMADVIFSGTDSRSALGMAEVSLTFCECEKELGVEWNEVRITRRVHRDGRGEYFLNKAPCRLKDIQQLFMDTGVGRSAYSIMEQGKIDLILSSRPEDRRAIFEEAAGITKYKAQKKEALRKLEYTEANLLRVQDIIKEVKRQIGSLQRQAAKARRYQAFMQDLRTFDTHDSHRNYLALRAELGDIRGELEGAEEARGIHEAEIAAQESDLAEFRARADETGAEIAALREKLQDLGNEVFAAESRIATNGERVTENGEMVARHRADIAAAEEKMLVQKAQIEETDQHIAAMIEALTSRQGELAAQEEKVAVARAERVAAEKAIGELAEEAARLEARVGSLRSEISLAAGRREAAETRLRLLDGESQAADRATAGITAEIESLSTRQTAIGESVRAAQEGQAAAARSYEEAQRARQEAEYALNTASKEAAAVESRLEVLRQLRDQGAGYDHGTQALLKGFDDPDLHRASVLGAMADEIRVPQDLVPAIEAALGGALQTVLFKDPEAARAAMESLASRKLGRAAAIPCEWVTDGNPDGDLPAGARSWAADAIEGHGHGARLAKGLLSGVVVASSLGEAFAIRRDRPGTPVATLRGEFIDRTGIIHGGQTGETTGHSALARKSEIEALEHSLTNAISTLEQRTTARNRSLEALEAAQSALLESKEILQSRQVEQASQVSERQVLERQLADLGARRGAFDRETAGLKETLEAGASAINELESGIRDTLAGIESVRERRAAAERNAQSAREREAAAVESLNAVKVTVAMEREQQESLTRQRGPMAARIGELTDLLESRRADISACERKIEALNEESSRLEISLGDLASRRAELEAGLAAASAVRDDLRSQTEAVETALKTARAQILELRDRQGALEVRAAQVEMRMENLRNHVSRRYQTDLEAFEPDTYALLAALRERSKRKPRARSENSTDAQADGDADEPSPDPSTDPASDAPSEVPADDPLVADGDSPPGIEPEGAVPWERIEELVAELTERVESMGPINLEAIEEFEELEQRHLFLEKQNADLVRSKVELMEVIAKINRTTREIFAETFTKVRENFRVMFSELFGGGTANLLLVDESDPLESGIEIIAKPPGKQLKSVSLLSGGERTMTAVALLFGIYMVKPSPFCVLDEMDAPLDESNISRFIKILDRFVDQSQFVVITHNKRTISRAEMLYGVTMEEHGISKLVSVRFNDRSEPDATEATPEPHTAPEPPPVSEPEPEGDRAMV